MLRLSLTAAIAALAIAATTSAYANSSGALRTSSGGTGLSTGHSSGGTGLSSRGTASGSIRGLGAMSPSRASTPASGTQQQMTPAKPHATPPAGVRPHTDLAAATKLIKLSSANLTKHSQLFQAQPRAGGDPALSGPILNKVGPVDGGTASFKAVYRIQADLGGGGVSPNHSGGATGRSGASLSGSSALGWSEGADVSADQSRKSSGGGILAWLHGLLTLAGSGMLGMWIWNARPNGAVLVPAAKAA